VDCQTMGNVEYWYCDVCGAAWLDEAQTIITNLRSVNTGYGEHSYFYPCDAHCMICGELTNEDAAHNVAHVEAVAPTRTANGNVEYWYCTDCGTAWLDEAQTQITNLRSVILPMLTYMEVGFVNRGNALLLEGAISIMQWVAFEAETDFDIDYVNGHGGLLVWMEADLPSDLAAAIVGSESYELKYEDAGEYQGYHEFVVSTKGIAAKEWGDVVYMRPYLEVDGVVQYGDMIEYSVLEYAKKVIEFATNDDPGDDMYRMAELYDTVVAMLNYGAAAQDLFDYKEDALMNSILSEEEKVLVWDDAYLTGLVEADASILGEMVSSNTMQVTGKALLLEGAVSIDYYVQPDEFYFGTSSDTTKWENASEAKFYFWTKEAYEALLSSGTAMSKGNASYSYDAIGGDYGYGFEYNGSSDGIPAKNLGDTLYACLCVTDANGDSHCSGVIVFSAEEYTKIVNERGMAEALLIRWMTYYGECAALYFA